MDIDQREREKGVVVNSVYIHKLPLLLLPLSVFGRSCPVKETAISDVLLKQRNANSPISHPHMFGFSLL